ncbi:MHS family MFS transporter [Amycolatopsis sp. K13G38]|uniref:MHS family MFS transporter n=1 Tax=Amycolatopsis acididurans TaxID=2724524 RepID=A0ABX1IVE2_9PSEU|nr:MFS transporter [Amycolatopsis acididurans]NKQ51426.1 MHS family MFS transporter [Amycolatopsis acididurans]
MTLGQQTQTTIDLRAQRRRILISGAIGTTIEYFDFLLYGLIAPVVFETLFFPRADALVATIAVLGTFAFGYLARPLGGIVFGHFGDRIGRKPVMFITLVLMGGCTTLIGLLPTYAAIGVAAPILLAVLRFTQGIALGGETVGAVIMATEGAPHGKRGGYAGFIQIGGALGSVLAALAAGLVAGMSEADRLSWGWRVPFLASAVLVLVGVYVRARIDESPVFRTAVEHAPRRLPLFTALREEPRACVTVFLCTIAETSMLQMFTVYILVYGNKTLHIDNAVMLRGVLIGNIVGIVANPVLGRLSDFVGRKIMLASSLVIGALYVSFAFFPMLRTGDEALIVLAIAIPPAVIQTLLFSTEGSFYAELFRDAARRFSGLGLSRQLGGVVGGFFPLIAASLFASAGTITAVIGYYVAISAISLGAVLSARETSRETLT